MGPVLATLKKTHPRIRVFALDDLSLMVRKAMVDRRADVGILVDTPQVEGLQCRALVREAMYLCGQDTDGSVRALLRLPAAAAARSKAPKPRAGAPAAIARNSKSAAAPAPAPRPEIDFADAVAQPLVLQSRRFAIRRSVEDAASERGLSLNIAHEQDSTRVLRSLYLSGAGFTFTPACALHDQPPSPRPHWVVARVVRPGLHRTYSLATQAGRPVDAATQVVMDALVQQMKSSIASGAWEAQWLERA